MVGISPCSPALGPGLKLWDKGLDLEMGLAAGQADLWGVRTALGSPAHRKPTPGSLCCPGDCSSGQRENMAACDSECDYHL